VKSRQIHPLVVIAVVVLFVLPILLFGGFYVRNIVLDSFQSYALTRATRASLDTALFAQLDEETGMRGYAATGERGFLQPYNESLRALPAALATLRRQLAAEELPLSIGDVDELAAINADWQRTVALPIVNHTAKNPTATQRLGKQFIDRYRAVIDRLDAAIAARRAVLDAQGLAAVDRITGFVFIATLIVLLVALGFGLQQRRLQQRLEAESRNAAEATAAYETEKRISDTLQEAFMLKPLPTSPSVRLSAIYIPATEETKVGGDWYDGVELDEGRVMFAIGDVAGHGLEAAVAMNRTRQAMLASALAGLEPAALLQRVNDELMREDARMVTAVCGYADSRAFAFTYATAGHPPPILLEPGRAPRLLDCGGVPLAVMAGAKYRSHTVQTVPGAMLVLYTDGAVEHSRDVLRGEQELLAAVAGSVGNTDADPADVIRDAIFKNRPVADDVAIVTLQFAEGTSGMGRLRLLESSVEFTASGPGVGPGAITSISPRAFRRLVASPERLAS
jgi:serine phosphatase RsbU (regulator of sigma subunit)